MVVGVVWQGLYFHGPHARPSNAQLTVYHSYSAHTANRATAERQNHGQCFNSGQELPTLADRLRNTIRLERTHAHTNTNTLAWPLPLAWDKALALGLGATNPCPTDVHMEPFSTSAFKGSLSRLFATTTKICTRGGSRPAHAGSLQRSPLRPSYSPGLGDLGSPPPRGKLGL